ncbi:LysR family transcriptional regulator [uncultured Shewanella sp.]|uniref:LysR family transcriptional regulator n=1 Tax=uncultured Shewanella sp. TaxID=173975 RepID=UPI00261A7D10|nr:LysR family transcriptional regulator [uncultured Shewanella sp.]
MDVKVFRTFLEVAKEKHFGRAAENLYITQAAVSARIKQLEAFFDASLFIRNRNAIKLTSAGERLIHYAEVMVSSLEQAKFELSLEKGKALQLTIGGTPNIWDAYLQNCLSRVVDVFQGYSFIAETLSRDKLNRQLLERTLDLAFALDPIKSDEFICTHISDLVLVLVSTTPCDENSAFKQHYFYVDWGTRFASEHAERHPAVSAPYMRTSNGRIALDFILEKGGTAYLPSSVVNPFISNGQLFKVQHVQDWTRPIYLSYRKSSTSLDAIKQVENLIQDLTPDGSYSLQQASEGGS